MFEVNLLFYGSSGGHKMDQKSFELLANMYHEIKEQLSEISKKLDKKADKVTLSGWKMNSPPKFKLCLMDTSSILTFWNALKMKL